MKSPSEIKVALDRAANMLEAKPAIGQRAYSSVATVASGLACAVTEKEWTFASDIPEAMGGENGAPSPSTLFRAAVASCVAMGIKMWAARKQVAIERVEVCFRTDVDARGQFGVCNDVAAGFEQANLSIRVVSVAAEGDVRAAIAASLRYSPMIDALKGGFPIKTDIEINQTIVDMKGVAA